MGHNLFVYPNRQTVVRQMFPINTDVFGLSDAQFVYVSLSPFGDEILETGDMFKSRVKQTIKCHIDDSMSLKQVIVKINETLAPLLNDLDSVNICITSMMQYGYDQEKFMSNAYYSLLGSDIPLEFLFKTLSPRVQVCDYFFVHKLLSLILVQGMEEKIKVHFFVDDPVEAQYPQFPTIPVRRFYFHKTAESNPLHEKLEYFPYPMYHIMRGTDLTNADDSLRDIDFSVGMTDYSHKDRSRSEMIRSLVKGFVEEKTENLVTAIRYASLDKELMEKRDKSNEPLSYQDYRHEISRSKFTLVVPSYHEGAWSSKRFWESLSVGCLPLIYDPVNRRQEGLSFDEEAISIVDKYLLLTCEPADICSHIRERINMISAERSSLVKSLLNTKIATTFRDENYYRQTLNNIFRNHE